MQLADYFIGKPGPGSISEAVAMRLPVIVERNAWTLPQERYNADWVREQGMGIVLPNFRGIAPAVDESAGAARLRPFPRRHGTPAQSRCLRNPGHPGRDPQGRRRGGEAAGTLSLTRLPDFSGRP